MAAVILSENFVTWTSSRFSLDPAEKQLETGKVRNFSDKWARS